MTKVGLGPLYNWSKHLLIERKRNRIRDGNGVVGGLGFTMLAKFGDSEWKKFE